MSTTVYVLRLSSGKFYVGKTDDVDRRWQQHLSGSGAAWTRKYKPVAIDKIIKNASPFDEDKVTKEYMNKHGIDNVRGGTYVTEVLDDFQKQALNEEMWQANGLCTQCGRSGHFVKDCYAKKDASGNAIRYEDDEDDEEEDEEDEQEYGCEYCDRTFTTAFGCRLHEKSCKEKQTTYVKKPAAKKEGACYRCGRAGHYSPDCYASRHVKGYELD
jgi:predicted GIY-YIG superfamily endonuclease